MAPAALTSNAFLLTSSSPHSRSWETFRNRRRAAFAERAGPFAVFRPGEKPANGGVDEGPGKGNSNPFFSFDFGKVPDVKLLVPAISSPSSGGLFWSPRRKDPNTVFVAGAAGQAGARIAQTLLRQGFNVRAGVPDLGAAQELARLASTYKIITKEELKRLNAVESTFLGAVSIAKAIGNASKAVVTIGPTEDGPASGVSTSDALEVVEAAKLAGVGHVAIIYDRNPAAAAGAASSTYNVLDGIKSFFGNLFSAEPQPPTVTELLERVVATAADVKYTLIKTSLTEDFSPESRYNVVVSAEGKAAATANDYKVAKSKIASVVADVFSNTAVAENKVVEVYTDPSAPARSVNELFSAIPEDGRRKAYAEALAKKKAEEEARVASERAQEAAEGAKKLEEEVKKLSEQEARAASLAEEAQEKAAGASVESLLNRAKEIGSEMSWEKFRSQIAAAVPKPAEDEAPNVQVAAVRGQARAWALRPNKADATKRSPPAPKNKLWKEAARAPKGKSKEEAEPKVEVRNVFGGLFKQETIYIDDD